MKKKELIQLIDSYFHNTVQLEQVEKAIRELAEEENISEIDEVMKKTLGGSQCKRNAG